MCGSEHEVVAATRIRAPITPNAFTYKFISSIMICILNFDIAELTILILYLVLSVHFHQFLVVNFSSEFILNIAHFSRGNYYHIQK